MSKLRERIEELVAHGYATPMLTTNAILSLVRSSIEKAKPKGKKHICRFNDGEQKCDCYYKALSDYDKAIQEILGKGERG